MSESFAKISTVDGVRGRGGSLVLAILGGLVAAVVGALIWMGITVLTGMHIGYVALGVGALVGMAIRFAGNGTTPIYGIIGALFTLAGCLGGETLAVVQSATTPQLGFQYALTHLDLSQVVSHLITGASPITYLIYGIGVFEGYKLSIRK